MHQNFDILEFTNFALEGTRMYTAAVLRPESVELLTKIMREHRDLESEGFEYKTPSGDPLPHHMTINLGRFDSAINDPSLLGEEAVLVVNRLYYCYTTGACAAYVCDAYSTDFVPIESINKNKHITICLKPPAKPFHSNDIFDKAYVIHLDEHLMLAVDIVEVE